MQKYYRGYLRNVFFWGGQHRISISIGLVACWFFVAWFLGCMVFSMVILNPIRISYSRRQFYRVDNGHAKVHTRSVYGV